MIARVSQLHKTEAEWQAYAKWVPEAGELVIYDTDDKIDYARIKVGDGSTPLSELKFFIHAAISDELLKRKYTNIIDGGRITDHD